MYAQGRIATRGFGHSKLESTVRYLGIEVDDVLEMAEQTGCSPVGTPVGDPDGR